VWERRRRRFEASGEPRESRPSDHLTDEQTLHLSVADVLRMGRKRRRSTGTRTRLATDITSISFPLGTLIGQGADKVDGLCGRHARPDRSRRLPLAEKARCAGLIGVCQQEAS
jgi:hypothetical protein